MPVSSQVPTGMPISPPTMKGASRRVSMAWTISDTDWRWATTAQMAAREAVLAGESASSHSGMAAIARPKPLRPLTNPPRSPPATIHRMFARHCPRHLAPQAAARRF